MLKVLKIRFQKFKERTQRKILSKWKLLAGTWAITCTKNNFIKHGPMDVYWKLLQNATMCQQTLYSSNIGFVAIDRGLDVAKNT